MNLNPTNINIVRRLLVGRSNRPLKTILSKTAPADLAHLFSMFNEREQRLLLEALISVDMATEVLTKVPESQVPVLTRLLDPNKFLNVLNECPEDHASYLLFQFDEIEREVLLSQLPTGRSRRLNQLLSYPEDSAGRMMDTQPFSIPELLTSQEGIEYIRKRAIEEPESFFYMYTVDKSGVLTGVLSLRALTQAAADQKLSELVNHDVVTVRPETASSEVARIVEKYDFVAIPVVDAEKKLIGVITVDDILDLIQEKATADIYASAGLQEDDKVYISARKSIGYRLPWMTLNLATAFSASFVVNLFEATMGKMILLAVFNNVVAGMGGNTAIQTTTVVTRGLATGDFNFTTAARVLLKETWVGLVLGIATGLAAALVVYLWKGSILVAGAIFAALIVNSLIATVVGASVPILLKKMKLDPATGSGVIVTTFTDICGFFSFLGIATLFLRLFGAQL